jgi:hypothetical protein
MMAIVACSSPTSTCDAPDGGIVGQWSIRGSLDAPVRGTLTGSIAVASANCTDFQGVMDLVEVLATGETRRVAGPVSGTIVDGTLVHFEASLGGGSREHLGRIEGDSLAGSWVEASGVAAGSGQFGGRRLGAH